MEFYSNFHIKVDKNLNKPEKVLKELYLQNPERNLNFPHSQDYYKDIFKLASQKSSDHFPQILLNSELEEDLFFQNGFDTEIYRHLRYLPANWHSHSFLEIVCVVQGHSRFMHRTIIMWKSQ